MTGGKNIVLEYGNGQNIVFDCRFKTQEGWIAGIEVLPCTGKVSRLSSNGVAKQSKQKDVNELHRELGHPVEDVTRGTGKHIRLTITGTFTPCEDC